MIQTNNDTAISLPVATAGAAEEKQPRKRTYKIKKRAQRQIDCEWIGPYDECAMLNFKILIDDLLWRSKQRDKEIITKRYCLEGHERQTLTSLGDELQLTRERVRQIVAKFLDELKLVVRGTSRKYAIEDEVRVSMQEFLEIVRSENFAHLPTLIDLICTPHDSIVPAGDLKPYVFLALDLIPHAVCHLDSEEFIGFANIQQLALFTFCNTGKTILKRLIRPEPLAAVAATIAKATAEMRWVTDDTVAALLQTFMENRMYVERLPDGRIQTRFDLLPALTMQAERILFERQRSMHYKELRAEVLKRLEESGTNRIPDFSTGLLSSNKNVKCIGKTGYWLLAEWGKEKK